MQRNKLAVSMLAALSMLGGGSAYPMSRRVGWSNAPSRKRIRRNSAGTKMQRKAEAGVLTMRAPGGLVSQTFREMQQRNFAQGVNK